MGDTMKRLEKLLRDEGGNALVTVLVVVALLIVLGTLSLNSTIGELQVSGNEKRQRLAFYAAESGLEYARAVIRREFLAATNKNTFVSNFATSPPSFTAPSGISFTVAPNGAASGSGTSSDPYVFRVLSEGFGPGNSAAGIEAVFNLVLPDSPIKYATFGDEFVKFKNHADVYSYDHTVTSNPTPAISTGEGDLFSNGLIDIKNKGVIDGDVLVATGAPDVGGNTTVLGDQSTASNPAPLENPDPLGLLSGGLLDSRFTSATLANNNGDPAVSPYVTGTASAPVLNLNTTITLPAGDYYFTSITLGTAANIISDGVVNIYLDGPLVANNAQLNSSGIPTDFSIYSRSTAPMEFKNNIVFRGLIYAPDASVIFQNNLTLYGSIFADDVDFQNGADIYYDTQMKYKFFNPNDIHLPIVAWRQL